MAHVANILDFPPVRRPKLSSATYAAPHGDYSDLARLIPGVPDAVPPASPARPILTSVAMHSLPRFCQRFEARMLAPAMLDVVLITFLFALENAALGPKSFHPVVLVVYVLSFLVFAIEEDLYLLHKTSLPENAAACRAVAWATLFASFFLRWSPEHGSGMLLCALSLFTLGALIIARWLRRTFRPAEAPVQNVLIVGSGIKAARVAEAIHRDQNSSRRVKGYITENHLRHSYGQAMLSRVAREQFADELVIASSDPLVIDAAVREAYKNKLDVKIAPDLCVPVSGVVENLND